MTKFVMINYPEPTSGAVQVNYRITNSGDIQHIECVVDKKLGIPNWLHMDKFSLTSMKLENAYDFVFETKKYVKNLDSVLFIDEVYAEILRAESYRIASQSRFPERLSF